VLNHGKLADSISGLGIKTDVLEESKNNFFALRRLLSKLLKGEKIDIIHTHRYKENILAAGVKKKCGIKRLVQTLHGVTEPARGLSSYKSRIYDFINRLYTRRYFYGIIAVSEEIKSRIEGLFPDSRIIAMHNAIDYKAIKPIRTVREVREELDIEDNSFLIGVVGRMVPVKGYDVFLRAAVVLSREYPQMRFILAGDGPERGRLEDLARKLNMAEKVIFTGFRDDILDLVNAFDILIFSSYHEGVPMALLEAMSLKKAVISTSVGGIKEVIEDGISGLLVRPGSPEDLAAACLNVFKDDRLRRDLGEGALNRVIRQFSIDHLCRRTVSFYEEVLKSP